MKNLQLSLKKKWFVLTKLGIKTEDYREINEYWVKRLMENVKMPDGSVSFIKGLEQFKKFEINTMTLGYPKSGDTERILKLEHKGIEIRTGEPDWGAEEGKLYFVIKHGEILKN